MQQMQFYVLDMQTSNLQLISNTPGIQNYTAGRGIQHPDYDYLYVTEGIGEDDVDLYAFDIETGETTRLSPQFPDSITLIKDVIFDESVTPAKPQEYFVSSENGTQLYQQSEDGQHVELIQDLPLPYENLRPVSDGYWYVEYNFDVEPYEQSQYFIPLYDTNMVIPVEIEEYYRLEMEVLYGWRFGEYSFAPAISIDNRDDQILYVFHYDPEHDWIAREIISPIGDYTNFRTPKTRDNEQFYFVLDNRLFTGIAPFDTLVLLTDETLIVSSVAHIFENGDLLVSAQEDGVDKNSTVFMLSCNQ